jgi:hypothetical protein
MINWSLSHFYQQIILNTCKILKKFRRGVQKPWTPPRYGLVHILTIALKVNK